MSSPTATNSRKVFLKFTMRVSRAQWVAFAVVAMAGCAQRAKWHGPDVRRRAADVGVIGVRQVAPLSSSVFSSRGIAFRWTPDVSGVVELARTREFRDVEHAVAGEGRSVVLGVDRGVWFWRVRGEAMTTPPWRLRIVGGSERVARQGQLAGGDFDGDGLDDYAVTQAILLGAKPLGSRWVELTYPPGIPCRPGAPAADRTKRCHWFGEPIAVGDLNGDGFDDWAQWARPEAETLMVFFGSHDVSSPLPGVEVRAIPGPGFTLARLGDVNGDGFGDVFAGTRVLFGTPGVPRRGEALPGFAIASGGADVDGDGIGDVAALSASGDLTILFGGRGEFGGRRWKAELKGWQKGDYEPGLVLGDMNADGLGDVVVLGVAGVNQPTVWVVAGAQDRSHAVVESPVQLGSPPATCALDLSGQGDGAVLLVMGSDHDRDSVHSVRFRRDTGIVFRPAQRSSAPHEASFTLVSVGDLDGDGTDDFAQRVDSEDWWAPHHRIFFGRSAPVDVASAHPVRVQMSDDNRLRPVVSDTKTGATE